MVFMIEIDWWVYVLIAVALFFAVLVINYFVKKMNEARLDDRLVRLQEKASASTYSQVQRQPLEMPSRMLLESIIEQSNPSTVTNTKPAEKRDDKDQIQIMNFPDSKKIDAPHTSNENKLNPTLEPPPTFLGAIYEKTTNVQKSKSNLRVNEDSILNNIVDTVVSKAAASDGTTANVKPMVDVQNKENLKTKELINVLVKNNSNHSANNADDKVAPTASTSL